MQLLIDVVLTFIYLCFFFLLIIWSWRFWMMYINQKFLVKFNADCILLEIKLPREITKSPLATEIAIASLLQGGGLGNWYAKVFDGNLPMYSSLEIASLEGVIHFYVRIHKKFRPLVEANFYAQYPGIEIIEVDDYTKKIHYHHLSKDVATWSIGYKLSKKWTPTDPETGDPYKDKKGKDYEMPADFLPIKTYVDFELDKNPDEEVKIDPITPLLEFMGGIGKGEYFWYQVLIQDESVYNGSKMPFFYVNDTNHDHISLSKMAEERKKQIRTATWNKKDTEYFDEYGDLKVKKSGTKDAEGKDIMVPAMYKETKAVPKKEIELIPEEKEELEIINKKLSKPLALVIPRIVYITKKENFDERQIQNLLTFGKPYAGANSFGFSQMTDPYDFSWEKMKGKRPAWRSEEIFEEYVEREGFFPHIPERKPLDKMEDFFFYPHSMKSRKMFRMIFEAIFYPFDHPKAKLVSTMNLEEVATLWHLPGSVAATPTLPRIDSVKGNAPDNLPFM